MLLYTCMVVIRYLYILYDTRGFSKKSNWFARLADRAGNSLVTKAVAVPLELWIKFGISSHMLVDLDVPLHQRDDTQRDL